MSVNDDIFDRAVDNAAMSRLFENEVGVETNRIVKRHSDRLGKAVRKTNFSNPAQKRVAMDAVGQEVKRFTKEINSNVSGHIKDFDAAQLEFHTNNLDKSAGEVFKVRKPRTNKSLESIVGPNIGDGGALSKQFSKIGNGEMKRINNTINNGIAKGLTNKEITSKI